MTGFVHDIRFAVRLLTRQPAFTIIAVAVLAIGIGANTAIFSVVDAVLLRPLPYSEPDRLVQVSNRWRKTGARATVSAPDYHDWRDQAVSFENLAAYAAGETSVAVDGAADYATAARVTPEFFDVMRARPEIGRLPSDAERRAGGAPTAVVGHAFWLSHLGGDRAALQKTIRFRDRLYTIVGVLPAGFRFPSNADIWLPWWTVPETTSRSAHNYRVVGRLRPGVSVEQAQAEMDAIASRLEQAYPSSNDGKGVAVDRLLDQIVRNVRTTLLGLFAAVAVILAMAGIYGVVSFSVAHRTGELGLRMALGAQRSSIVRLTMFNGVRVAAVGVAVGLRAAVAFARVLDSMLFATTAREPGVFAGVAALLLAVAALASATPAIRAACVDPAVALRGD